MGRQAHLENAPKQLTVAIVSVSSTRRTPAGDQSGSWMRELAEMNGHRVVFHGMVDDDRRQIENRVKEVIDIHSPNILITTGGTGLAPRDVTIEAVRPLFEKEIPAFGALFAQLSYIEIDSGALLSRAAAGVIGRTAVFCLPGSLNACKLACRALIFPEAGHIITHVCSHESPL